MFILSKFKFNNFLIFVNKFFELFLAKIKKPLFLSKPVFLVMIHPMEIFQMEIILQRRHSCQTQIKPLQGTEAAIPQPACKGFQTKSMTIIRSNF